MNWQMYEGYGRWNVVEVNPAIPSDQLWLVEFYGPNAEAQAREYTGWLQRAESEGSVLGKAAAEYYQKIIEERMAR